MHLWTSHNEDGSAAILKNDGRAQAQNDSEIAQQLTKKKAIDRVSGS